MEKLLKTKTDKKQFLKWIDALESGKYSQTIGILQNREGYCCLGVACKVLIPKTKQKLTEGELDGNMPSSQTYAPDWLRLIDTDFQEKSRTKVYLTVLNDSRKESFKEIAAKLKSAYKKELEVIK